MTLRDQSSLWKPLQVPIFRRLLAADVASDIGTFMQSVGAAWLMVSLHAGPIYVALIQTASSLPFFLLALPAGALGDIVDRRRLILTAQFWMASVALLISAVTIGNRMSPVLLLLLTFALSAGDALETPTWRAILPELVSKDDITAASALNGIEFNIARAVGPALAGVLVATAGVAWTFLVNFVSFVGVIFVVLKWKRAPVTRTSHVETLTGATIDAIRYVRYSPAIIVVLVRTGAALFFSSALFALLPTVSRDVNKSAIGYGLLLGCFGVGAILGALIMQSARARWSNERIVSSGTAVLGIAIAISSRLHSLPTLAPILLVGGASWVLFISLISALIQNLVPDWVRARVLAIYLLVYQGSFAFGSAVWGAIAQREGVGTALLIAGVGTSLTAILTLVARISTSTADLNPWDHWRMPLLSTPMSSSDPGPVLITVEYAVSPANEAEFTAAIHNYGRLRRRDGAFRWGVYRDVDKRDRYVEIFLVSSWSEHQRQHERYTQTDHESEQQLRGYIVSTAEVRHLISAPRSLSQ